MSLFEQAKALAVGEIMKEVPDNGTHAAWINTKAHQARIMTEEAMWNSLNNPKSEYFTTKDAIFAAAQEIMKQYKMLGVNLDASESASAAAPPVAACEAANE